MNDKELLIMAAKAAGLVIRNDIETKDCIAVVAPTGYWGNEHIYWNPLTDDADALRLAVKLGIMVKPEAEGCKTYKGKKPRLGWLTEECVDPYAATRRAIVRAAAAIAESHIQGREKV
jgi:hypothetical protein